MSIELIVTIALAVVILAIAIGNTARNRRVRPLVIGVGLAALVVGLFLTGVSRLIGNGVLSLIDWFQRTVFTNTVAWGLGLAVGGLALAVIGFALPKAPRRTSAHDDGTRQRPVREAGSTPQQVGGGATSVAAKPAAAQPAPANKKAVDPEDAEIEALLRKRGIL